MLLMDTPTLELIDAVKEQVEDLQEAQSNADHFKGLDLTIDTAVSYSGDSSAE